MSTSVEANRVDAAAAVTDIVDDEAGFDELESIWRELEQGSPDTTPCRRWDWSRLWWAHYARACDRPWIIVVRLAGEIVGLCPLYLRDARRTGGRRLRFLATGEPEHTEVASEFLDVLAAPGHRDLVASAAVAAISGGSQWREVELRNVLESAAIAASWAFGAAERCGRIRRGLRYTLSLDESWEDYLSRLAPRFRTRVRAQIRAFDAGQQALIEVPEAQRAAVFELMAELHRRHWQRRGRPGAFHAAVFREFHQDLLRRWGPTREALLRTLLAGGDVVGVLYSFRWNRQEAYYQSGLNLDDRGIRSPGLACHVGAIRQARNEACESYDFMLGKADSYKADYGCTTAPVVDLGADRRGSAGRLVDRGLARLGRG